MALALYRKYRPRTFAEVIGQEHVTEPLSQALRSGRLNHAYLFSGPRGCGKTSSARILARSLNCEQGPTPEPCGVCASCKSLANDGAGSIDVIEIDAASHGGVDDARELREKAFFAPAGSRYKIYVIDEAHMVSPAGFNALLKLVEEPPEYVKFIFATTEPDKVLGTIRSRTHHYPFRLIPPAVLRPYLQQLADAEGITVEPSVLPLVVRAGGGSARDTLSILDQLIAGSGPEGVTYGRAVALLGVTDAALIDEMCDALATGDGAAAYATIDRVAEAGHEPRRFASDLLERLRDLIILQQVPDAVAKGLIDGPADQLEAMAGQAARLGAATLSRCADIVHNGLVEMRGTTAPRLLLELLTARMLLPGAEASSAALLQRLERLEQGITRPPASGSAAGVPAASVEVRGGQPAVDPTGDVTRGAAAGGGAKAAAMAAARAASSRPGPAVVRPVSPAAPSVSGQSVSGQGAPEPAGAAQTVHGQVDPASGTASSADAAAAASSSAGSGQTTHSSDSAASDAQQAGGAAPSSRPVSRSAGPEPDWNGVAEGRRPMDAGYDEEPPWDDEPPAPRVSEFDRVRAVWEELTQTNQRVGTAQSHGVALGRVDGQAVVITAPTAGLVARMRNLNELLADEFSKALGGRWQVRCEVGDPPGSGPARGPAGDNRSGAAGPAHPSAPERNAGPERNTGRSEPRPSRPAQRGPSADSEDDWPAAARPPADRSARAHAPESDDRPHPVGAGDWPEPARPPQTVGGDRRGPAADTGRSEPVRPGASSDVSRPAPSVTAGHAQTPATDRGVSSETVDVGWPEPAGPGVAERGVSPAGGAVAGDGDRPEPARPPAMDGGATPSGGSAAGDGGWPEPVRPPVSAEPSRPGSVRAGSAAGGEDWPEPARPGAGRSDPPAAHTSSDWPDPVRPGGGAEPAGGCPTAAPSVTPVGAGSPVRPSVTPARAGSPVGSVGAGGSSLSAGSAARPAGGSVGGGSALGGAAVSAAPARSAAMEAARAAARTGKDASGGGAAAARAALAGTRGVAQARPAAGGSSWSDGSPTEEAPYDPEYDGPPSAAAAPSFDGFDPGDEPLDDVIDEKTARQSGEEQAMQLLRAAFGAEKIGEL
ncbi:DNA polymerase III subunit gamma and tau [Actinoplanes sp. NPDC049802]|uniref:DNA polymerase III subunit gamma and tau n=1 Tax=Actinoplanes sp. NPDC049802 TaxID=3154742 RepID=UPI0033F9B3A6